MSPNAENPVTTTHTRNDGTKISTVNVTLKTGNSNRFLRSCNQTRTPTMDHICLNGCELWCSAHDQVPAQLNKVSTNDFPCLTQNRATVIQ